MGRPVVAAPCVLERSPSGSAARVLRKILFDLMDHHLTDNTWPPRPHLGELREKFGRRRLSARERDECQSVDAHHLGCIARAVLVRHWSIIPLV